MTNESSALPKKAFELVKRFERHSGVLEDIDSRLTNALTSKDDPTLCNLLYEEFTRKLDDLEVVLRQMDSIDHQVMVNLRATAAELQSKKLTLLLAVKKHEIEFKSAPTRSSSRSSQSSRAPISNTRPPSESEPTYTIPTNVASPMDRSAPLNLDPVSIASTFHPSQNTSNPTSLHQMDMLDVQPLFGLLRLILETPSPISNITPFNVRHLRSHLVRCSVLIPKTPSLNTPVTNPVTHMGRRLYGSVSVVLYLPINLRFQQQQRRSGLYLVQALKQVISSVNVLLSNYQTSNLTALMVIPCFGPTGSVCSSLLSTITSDSASRKNLLISKH